MLEHPAKRKLRIAAATKIRKFILFPTVVVRAILRFRFAWKTHQYCQKLAISGNGGIAPLNGSGSSIRRSAGARSSSRPCEVFRVRASHGCTPSRTYSTRKRPAHSAPTTCRPARKITRASPRPNLFSVICDYFTVLSSDYETK